LRIAGFADLASLYLSLSQQMELYFEEISSKMPGYEDFVREAWSFKVDFNINSHSPFFMPLMYIFTVCSMIG
jgi:hypothetical protein